uniref:Uncharacterized protein n=1 Tax=Rhizophora mucronata TaxID=61149 RepID=A0A2P2PH60_RHIMU
MLTQMRLQRTKVWLPAGFCKPEQTGCNENGLIFYPFIFTLFITNCHFSSY